MNGGRVRYNGLNISQINPDGDRACALVRPFFSKLDEPPAIEFWDPQPPQSVFKKGEAHPFGTTNAFADPLQVFAMQLDQIAECFRVAGASRDCGFAAIDAPLDLKRPFLGILSAQERLIDIFSFPPHLGSLGPGIELGECRQNVCAPCALSRRTAA